MRLQSLIICASQPLRCFFLGLRGLRRPLDCFPLHAQAGPVALRGQPPAASVASSSVLLARGSALPIALLSSSALLEACPSPLSVRGSPEASVTAVRCSSPG